MSPHPAAENTRESERLDPASMGDAGRAEWLLCGGGGGRRWSSLTSRGDDLYFERCLTGGQRGRLEGIEGLSPICMHPTLGKVVGQPPVSCFADSSGYLHSPASF